MKVIIEFNPNVASDLKALAKIVGVMPPIETKVVTREEATSDHEADQAEQGTPVVKQVVGGFGKISTAGPPGSASTSTPPGTVISGSAEVYPSFTSEDVVEATLGLANVKGVPAAAALLKEFGVEKAKDVPVEKRGDYITAAAKAKNA